jgi:hypothetical protein
LLKGREEAWYHMYFATDTVRVRQDRELQDEFKLNIEENDHDLGMTSVTVPSKVNYVLAQP